MGSKGNKRREKTIAYRNTRPFWLLLLTALFAAAGILGGRSVLLKNADAMGSKLVQSYAKDEELNIGIYANLIEIGMAYINDQIREGESTEKVEEWLIDYFEKTGESMGADCADAYAVIGGRTIAYSPWKEIEDYDFRQTDWYRQAIEAEGAVIFTDAYVDSVYGEQVITIAAADSETGNAVAFDLFPQNMENLHEKMALFEASSYYLCDSSGKVIFYRASFDVPQETIRAFAEELYLQTASGSLKDSGSIVRDLDGKKRSVYSCATSNGWMCILTVPLEALYENMQEVYLYYAGVALVALAIILAVWIRDRRLRRYIEDSNDTIQMLGNSYYAIYRVETQKGTYEMTKAAGDIRSILPYSGDYEDLLSTLVERISEETRQDFARSFSMDNIIALAGQGAIDFGGDFKRLFGEEYRWVNVRLVQDPVNHPGEAVLCFREIEEEKRRQTQTISLLENALTAADASRESQKQFFSSMSHDMRTPLNVILGMARLGLREDCSQEKMRDYLEKISVSGKQLLALINDILEMSRMEQGKIDLDNRTFNICDTLELCVAPFRMQAENEGKEFTVSTEITAPVVYGDPSRLTQILNNLISNAVKFTEPGDSISVHLKQVKRSAYGRYIFVIKDTGAGMSEEFLPRLFEPYEREKRFSTRNIAGTGLGMPIVKNLVNRMGGEITVESKVGEGTKFVVMIPFTVSNDESAAEDEKEKEDLTSLEGKCILLAEDNPLNREIVTELLTMQGIEVTCAENGREAVERFEESKEWYFDTVLLDVQMPEMDGCEAAGAIRSLNREDAKTVPIIALTANAFPEDIARTAAAGMNAHLCKPIEPEILFTTLQQVQR